MLPAKLPAVPIIALGLALLTGLSAARAADPSADFGVHRSECRLCVPSDGFRRRADFPVPRRAIIFDFSNGVFWKNSRLLVVDVDREEAATYRFPPNADHPTRLELLERRSMPGELIRMANVTWNPPRATAMEPMRTDTFQTLYVVDGSIMAESLEVGGGAPWFTELRDQLGKLVTR